MSSRAVKIVLLGDGAVGKTSLVRRYIEQRFDDSYITTIGANVKKKELEEYGIRLIIWDLYGQKLGTNLQDSNYYGTDGAIVVFDLTRKKTLEHVKGWLRDLYRVVGKVPVVFAGNKRDIIDDFEQWSGKKLKADTKKEFHDFMVKHHYVKGLYSKEPRFVPATGGDIRSWFKKNKEILPKERSTYMTSAKTSRNVENVFRRIAKYLVEKK